MKRIISITALCILCVVGWCQDSVKRVEIPPHHQMKDSTLIGRNFDSIDWRGPTTTSLIGGHVEWYWEDSCCRIYRVTDSLKAIQELLKRYHTEQKHRWAEVASYERELALWVKTSNAWRKIDEAWLLKNLKKINAERQNRFNGEIYR